MFCILFGIVLSGEEQRSESLTFGKAGEFLGEEGAEGRLPFRVADARSHQNTEPRQCRSSSVTSVWLSGRAVHQGCPMGTTAEVGSEDMDTTCGEVLLCTWRSVMSVSTVTKICPPLFPWDSISSGELSILQSS